MPSNSSALISALQMFVPKMMKNLSSIMMGELVFSLHTGGKRTAVEIEWNILVQFTQLNSNPFPIYCWMGYSLVISLQQLMPQSPRKWTHCIDKWPEDAAFCNSSSVYLEQWASFERHCNANSRSSFSGWWKVISVQWYRWWKDCSVQICKPYCVEVSLLFRSLFVSHHI